MIRASIESVRPIRRIESREVDHLQQFAAATRRSLPGRDEAVSVMALTGEAERKTPARMAAR